MSDADVRFHEEWLGLVQPIEGLVVSIPVLVDAQCIHRHPPSLQKELLELLEPVEEKPQKTKKSEEGEQPQRIRDVETFLQRLLGWKSDLYDSAGKLPEELRLYVHEGKQTIRPTLALRKIKLEQQEDENGEITPAVAAGKPYIAMVWEIPDGLPFDKPETETGPWEYPPAAKFDRLLRYCRVPIGLLTNRRSVRLLYAPHGESSGSITFHVDHMATVGGRIILDALVMLLSANRFFGFKAEHQLPALLIESRKRQINVTNKLADQVFEALQILLAGFEGAAERDKQYAALLQDALEREHDHLYGGLLTVLLRIVFALYAEDRNLLPVESKFYAKNLSILGLFDELQADQGAYPDAMSRRFGAWGRLLSLFRAIFFGAQHGDLYMPARRGELFDPHQYPFLEGWGPGGSAPMTIAEHRAQVNVPGVDDETIFLVLQKLLILEGQRLSYRTLDVEQIGSVYEALMGYHVQRMLSPAVCLKPDRAKAVWLSAKDVIEVPKAQRAKWLKTEVGLVKAHAAKIDKELGSVKEEDKAQEILESFRIKHSEVARAGRLVIQPGNERRRTSSHYTPRSLSAPIVERTLEPLIKVMGEAPSSERILNLKVCDPAMGSGAFLVEACRYLGDQVIAAWTREKRLDKIADQHGDVVNHARRLVAQRCIYGVDKNRFAVNLAKLSIWLVTLAKDQPFTFVDHALRHGDSLVGLDFEQIRSFHWKPGKQLELCHGALEEALSEAIKLRQQILELADSSDPLSTKEKFRLLGDAEDALDRVRLIGDLVIGAFFSSTKDKERLLERERRLRQVEAWLRSGGPIPDELKELQWEINQRLPVFHWMVEFPEIFFAERPDPLDDDQVNRAALMDAFVGNPPFAGKNNINEFGGPELLDWLKTVHEGAHGNADYCAHFFRRADMLLGAHGTIGLIATNTIAQGDTRSTSLQVLMNNDYSIYDAKRSVVWPGDAAVTVSVVHLAKGNVSSGVTTPRLDGKHVAAVNSRLRPKPERPDPQKLENNDGKSFQGSVVLGMGFTLTNEAKDDLVARNKRNEDRIFAYLGGEEINTSPIQEHHRYVINFEQMSLYEAEQWPDLIQIVRDKVKPERDRLRNNPDGRRRKQFWWQFGRYTPALFDAIRPLPRCLVCSRVSKHLILTFQPPSRIFAESLYVFPLPDHSQFSILQSRIHSPWAWLLSSSMKTDLRYAASDCFDTFPFPQPDPRIVIPELEDIGKRLYEFRAQFMKDEWKGLTQTYNMLKDPDCHDERIEELRRLHIEMDEAVIAAYGWIGIKIPPYTTPTNKAEQKAMEAFEDEIIDKLFVLNAERAAEEEKQGLTGKKKKKTTRKTKKKNKNQLDLVSDD